jgi:Uma2 family endonuclease
MNDVSKLDLSKRYTVNDYLSWTFEQSCELIDGFIYWMSAPNANHFKVNSSLCDIFKTHINLIDVNKKYVVCYAPLDVYFSDKDVVQPDVFICKENQIMLKGCIGPPVLIVEILSPSNKKKDIIEKHNLYEKFEVEEYWVANPKTKSVVLYSLQDDKRYDDGQEFAIGDTVTSTLFPDLSMEINEIFKNMLPYN